MSRAANLAAQEIQEAIEHDARMLDDAEALASIIDRRFSNAAIVTITDMQAACDSAIASLNAEGKWTAGDVGNYTAAFFSGWHARSNFTPPERTRVEGEQGTWYCLDCDSQQPIEGAWMCSDGNVRCAVHRQQFSGEQRAATAPADNDAESLLSKITIIADIGSAGEFGDALERLKSIRQLIDTTTKGDH